MLRQIESILSIATSVVVISAIVALWMLAIETKQNIEESIKSIEDSPVYQLSGKIGNELWTIALEDSEKIIESGYVDKIFEELKEYKRKNIELCERVKKLYPTLTRNDICHGWW